MKFCYIIQTHKNPEQIYRLIKIIKMSSPEAYILVSHNFTSCNLDVTNLQNLPDVKVLAGKGGRGDFSTGQRYLDAIDWLLSHNIEFDWLINLTGQDYPTQPLSQIESFLAETTYDGFIEYFEVFSKQSHWSIREAYRRYFYRYYKLLHDLPNWQKKLLKPLQIINYVQPFYQINFSYGLAIGIKTSTPFQENFICYGGSFFNTISKKCVQYLHDFIKSNPDVLDYYKNALIGDESLIQTVLVNSQLFNFCNDSKRYVDFSKSRNGHPRILTKDDYPSLVQSHIHFARKFDMTQDSKILDLLDTRIMQSLKVKPLAKVSLDR